MSIFVCRIREMRIVMSKTMIAAGLAGVLVAGGLVATAAPSASAGAAEAASVNVEAVDPARDADIFRAVFFLQGPLSDGLYDGTQIEQIPDFDLIVEEANHPDAVTMVDGVVDDIEATDPEYFTTFGEAMTSGDPHAVQAAIEAGRVLISETPTAIAAAQTLEETYVPGEMGTMCGTVVVVGAFFVLAAGVFAVAGAVLWLVAGAGQAVAVAETLTAVRNVSRTASADPVYEEWIANLTRHFAL
jgi:SdpC family antimicrobial peptide